MVLNTVITSGSHSMLNSCHLINDIRLYASFTSSRWTNKIFLLQKRAHFHSKQMSKIIQAPDIPWFIIRVSASVVFRQSGQIPFWHCLLQDLASTFTDISLYIKTFSVVRTDFFERHMPSSSPPPNIHSRFLSVHS